MGAETDPRMPICSPETESGRTSSFQNRGRMVLRYFESFKTACKKKLSATAQQELDRGVDMVNDLLTEVCSENMIIYGRYLELKERLEEKKKKKVEFEIPSGKQTTSDINSVELVTTDNEEGTSSTNKGKRKKKGKTKAENKESTKGSDTEKSGRDSGSERSKTGSIKKSKKEKEKEMLDKCRSQAAPVKFIVATGDKTIEDTKKVLWTQVVSKNKPPKIKELVTLKGGDLLITPADEKTKESIKSLAEEGFGITQTGNLAPKVIIYDVDRQIAPMSCSSAI